MSLAMSSSQPSRIPHRLAHRLSLPALALVSAVLLSGCFTGQRPHFADDNPFDRGSPTGDAAIDAVLVKLDAVTAGPVAASYDVLTKFGNANRPASVQLDGSNRSIQIGEVRYIKTDTLDVTCTIGNNPPCVEGWKPEAISDTLLTVDFYAPATAARLRRDAAAALAPGVGSAETLAGLPATCVQVTLPGGTAKYCVLDNGLVALLDDGDVRVSLMITLDVIDPAQFAEPL